MMVLALSVVKVVEPIADLRLRACPIQNRKSKIVPVGVGAAPGQGDLHGSRGGDGQDNCIRFRLLAGTTERLYHCFA